MINPVGYRIMVRPVEKAVKKVTDGGIVLPEQVMDAKNLFNQVAEVVAVGPEAYKHPKFMGVAWCKPGDFIIHNSYSGLRVDAKEIPTDGEFTKYRFINDDEVVCTTDRPEDIRIYVD